MSTDHGEATTHDTSHSSVDQKTHHNKFLLDQQTTSINQETTQRLTATNNMLVNAESTTEVSRLSYDDSGEDQQQVYIPEDIAIPTDFILRVSQTYDGKI